MVSAGLLVSGISLSAGPTEAESLQRTTLHLAQATSGTAPVAGYSDYVFQQFPFLQSVLILKDDFISTHAALIADGYEPALGLGFEMGYVLGDPPGTYERFRDAAKLAEVMDALQAQGGVVGNIKASYDLQTEGFGIRVTYRFEANQVLERVDLTYSLTARATPQERAVLSGLHDALHRGVTSGESLLKNVPMSCREAHPIMPVCPSIEPDRYSHQPQRGPNNFSIFFNLRAGWDTTREAMKYHDTLDLGALSRVLPRQ